MPKDIIFYVIICLDTKELVYCAAERYECQNHINDAIDRNIEEASHWVIRQAVTTN